MAVFPRSFWLLRKHSRCCFILHLSCVWRCLPHKLQILLVDGLPFWKVLLSEPLDLLLPWVCVWEWNVLSLFCLRFGQLLEEWPYSPHFPQISLYWFFAQAAKAFSPESSDMSVFLEKRQNLESKTLLASSMANGIDWLCISFSSSATTTSYSSGRLDNMDGQIHSCHI